MGRDTVSSMDDEQTKPNQSATPAMSHNHLLCRKKETVLTIRRMAIPMIKPARMRTFLK